MKEKNLQLLLKAIGDVELTEDEKRSIEWLAGREFQTVENICSVIEKVKIRIEVKANGHERTV